LFSTGFADVIQVQQAQESILFIMILGVVGTGIANILFFKLIQISSPVLHFGNLFDTGCSFLWGLLDEMLTAIQFLERLSF
jgi:drug/metabolite transporter (DMT)-like permease